MQADERVFVSRLEDVMKARELVFEPTPGFGRWRPYFPDDAVAHPAKANLNMIEYLVLKYSRVGDLVLDPMAGTGSTCVMAVLNGRDGICVDVEDRFVKWMLMAKERVENASVLGRKGRMTVIHGDARELSKYVSGSVDAIITSPPYGDAVAVKGNRITPVRPSKDGRLGSDPKDVTFYYSLDPGNIGNLEWVEYLNAMLKVYTEMFKVLKQGGLAAVIVKPFVKGGRAVDLPLHTHILMSRAGFKLYDLIKYEIENRTFWKILNERKNPRMPKIRHEYILVGVKP